MDELENYSFYHSRPSRHYITRYGHDADCWPTVADYNNLNPVDAERECRAITAGTLFAHSLGDFAEIWRDHHVINRKLHNVELFDDSKIRATEKRATEKRRLRLQTERAVMKLTRVLMHKNPDMKYDDARIKACELIGVQ